MKILSCLVLCFSGSRFHIAQKPNKDPYLCLPNSLCSSLRHVSSKLLFTDWSIFRALFTTQYGAHLRKLLKTNFRNEGAQLNLVKFWETTQMNQTKIQLRTSSQKIKCVRFGEDQTLFFFLFINMFKLQSILFSFLMQLKITQGRKHSANF